MPVLNEYFQHTDSIAMASSQPAKGSWRSSCADAAMAPRSAPILKILAMKSRPTLP